MASFSDSFIFFRKCDRLRIKNYYTGGYGCPVGFKTFYLHQWTQKERLYRRRCRACGFLWLGKCCRDVYIGDGQRTITLNGCIKNITHQPPHTKSIYVYGGSFTSKKINPVTNQQRCPPEFAKLPGPNDIKVCLAERVKSSLERLPSFGGIFSCNSGNPALSSGAKACPTNYSMHSMGTIGGSCILSVCLKFLTYDDAYRLPSIVLPPFSSIDNINWTSEVNDTMETGVITSKIMYEGDIIELHTTSISTSTGTELKFSMTRLFVMILALVSIQYQNKYS